MKTQYRLIKKYPGSPKVGDIVEGYGRDGWYSKGEGHSTYDWRQVVNYPEYWEEVVEKDYQILKSCPIEGTIYSVKRLSDGEVFTVGDKFTGYSSEGNTIQRFELLDNILIIHTTDKGSISNTPGTGLFKSIKKVVEKDYEILYYLKKGSTTCTTTKRRGGIYHDGFWDIHSVKRLSDGEVFTLGDKIKVYQHGSIKTIDSIDLMKEGIWFTYDSGSCHMTHVIKQTRPIYLTHDGKDIFPEDIVWYVNKENFYHDYIKAYPEVKFNSDIRAYFLTEEEAKKYIIENKPALSIKEFWEITWMSTSGFNKHTYMKNLVKERLNLK